jgi:hypothetical protein
MARLPGLFDVEDPQGGWATLMAAYSAVQWCEFPSQSIELDEHVDRSQEVIAGT